MDIEAIIGFGAAPLLIIALVDHIKKAVHAARQWLDGRDGVRMFAVDPEATPWPLVADALAVAWAVALYDSGMFPEQVTRLTTVVLLGLALGVGASMVRDQVTARRAA
jgi:hypothetical protein